MAEPILDGFGVDSRRDEHGGRPMAEVMESERRKTGRSPRVAKDAPDCGCDDLVAESGEFGVDAAVAAPSRGVRWPPVAMNHRRRPMMR